MELNVSVEVAFPPGGTPTLDGLIDQEGHDAQRGGGETVRLIVLLNPLMLDRRI